LYDASKFSDLPSIAKPPAVMKFGSTPLNTSTLPFQIIQVMCLKALSELFLNKPGSNQKNFFPFKIFHSNHESLNAAIPTWVIGYPGFSDCHFDPGRNLSFGNGKEY